MKHDYELYEYWTKEAQVPYAYFDHKLDHHSKFLNVGNDGNDTESHM